MTASAPEECALVLEAEAEPPVALPPAGAADSDGELTLLETEATALEIAEEMDLTAEEIPLSMEETKGKYEIMKFGDYIPIDAAALPEGAEIPARTDSV